MEASQIVVDLVNKYLDVHSNMEVSKKMAITRDWRPENWDRIKEIIVSETPVVFSPSAGYTKDQKEQLIEKTASMVLGALAEVLVADIQQ